MAGRAQALPAIINTQSAMKKYWYMDNWCGDVHEFDTLRQAKKAAKAETGVTVTIYRHGKDGSRIVCFAKACGICPP